MTCRLCGLDVEQGRDVLRCTTTYRHQGKEVTFTDVELRTWSIDPVKTFLNLAHGVVTTDVFR